MGIIDESWEKTLDAQLLRCHQEKCKKECDNFDLAREVCAYYHAEYGYFNYCFRLEYGEYNSV